MNDEQIFDTEPLPEPVADPIMLPVDPATIAAAEMAKKRIELAYFMAERKPRHEQNAWNKILSACERPGLARKAIYSKPVGGSSIEGPSIRLAEEIIKLWGNITVSTQVVYEDGAKVRINVMVVDLETNTQYAKDINIAKTIERKNTTGRTVVGERINSSGSTVYIVEATDEEMLNKLASAESKVIRNSGLRLIPSDVIDDAVRRCYATMEKDDAVDPGAANKRLMFEFGKLGVEPRDIELYIGCTMSQMDDKQRNELRGVFRAIKDGETTWAAALEVKTVDPSKTAVEATQEKIDKMKGEMADEEPAPDEGAPAETDEPDDWDVLEGTDLRSAVYAVASKKLASKAELEALVKNADSTDGEFRALARRCSP